MQLLAYIALILTLISPRLAEAGRSWEKACRRVVVDTLYSIPGYRTNMPTDIIEGIKEAYSIMERDVPDQNKLNMCHYTVATAQQESYFQFSIGRHGEIGMYQFKANTVRSTYKYHKLDWPDTDEDIVRSLLKPKNATIVFVLHFRQLLDKHKTIWLAWRAYNAGKSATQYANQVMSRYHKVRRHRPLVCKPGEVDGKGRKDSSSSFTNSDTRKLYVD